MGPLSGRGRRDRAPLADRLTATPPAIGDEPIPGPSTAWAVSAPAWEPITIASSPEPLDFLGVARTSTLPDCPRQLRVGSYAALYFMRTQFQVGANGHGINEAGAVVGLVAFGGNPTPFMYVPGSGTVGLGTLVAGVEGWANALNDTGLVVGSSRGQDGRVSAVMWRFNGPPAAIDDTASLTAATTPADQVSIDVLANDSDPDGDALTVTAFTLAANGSLTHNADGTFTFTRNPGFNGTDSFTYTISDGALTATATVRITVTVDIPPDVNLGDNVTIAPGATVESGATVGDGTVLSESSTVESGATVGSNVVLQESSTVGSGATVGDGTVLSESATVESGATVGSGVTLGEGATVGSGAVVGEGAVLEEGAFVMADAILGAGSRVGLTARVGIGAELGENVVLEESAQLGDGAWVGDDTTIGASAIVGASALVGHDVTIGANAVIADGAVVPDGTVIPPGGQFP